MNKIENNYKIKITYFMSPMSESYVFYLRNYSLETIKMIRNPIKYKIYL